MIRAATLVPLVLLGSLAAGEARAQCATPLYPFDGETDVGYGRAVAMEGSIAAIGAPWDDVLGPSSGSVYVLDVVTGQRLHKLVASDGLEKDQFGRSLEMEGDLLVVGAIHWYDAGGPAYVFDLTTGTELRRIRPPDTQLEFGKYMDVDGGRVAIGHPPREKAYVYDVFGGPDLELSDSSPLTGTEFGRAVALRGTVVAVGAPLWTDPTGRTGRVVLFDSTSGQELFTIEAPVPTEQFGQAVVIEGDKLVVGGKGSVAVFDLGGTFLLELDVPPYMENLRMAADGNLVFVGTYPATSLSYVFNLNTGKRKHVLDGGSAFAMGADRWLVGRWGLADPLLFDVEDDDGDGYYNCEELGTNYCGPAVPNSTGASAYIAAGGSPVLEDDDLRLRAISLPPHKPGFFLASRTQGFVAMPGGSQGNLCLGGAIGRLRSKAKDSGKTGRFAIVVPLDGIPPGEQHVLPGESWNFQAWYRDVHPTPTSNFTDAVNVLFE